MNNKSSDNSKKWFVKKTLKKFNLILMPYLIVLILLIVIPIILILLYSIIHPTNNSLDFKYNFDNFLIFFNNKAFVVSMLLAIALALCASVLALLIGYPIAYFMAFNKSKILSQNIWILVTLPIWINMLLKMIGLETLFKMIAPGLLGTPFSIMIGMVYAFLPFGILPVYNSLQKFDKNLIYASKDLGASNWQTFWRITLKYSIPGLLAGGVMILVQSATSLVIIRFLGEGKVNLIVEVIESYFFKSGNFGIGAAISLVLAVIIFTIISISIMISKKYESPKKKRFKTWKEF